VVNIGSVDGLHAPLWQVVRLLEFEGGIASSHSPPCKTLASDGITVNAIAPGIFESRMTQFAFEKGSDELVAATPMGRVGESADALGAAVFLASLSASWITGVVLQVDGGYGALR
jgi:NAD(P)-dependent dehydrogenase (short-subunit alcohol dehydrogenase family)